MADFGLMGTLSMKTPSKIVLLVVDGLGGLPDPATGKTELETANIPNLDALAGKSICGLTDPVSPGITPGSAPGHLGLFGYDPVRFNIGRGVLEAVGTDFPLGPNDVAARGNFCTVDATGNVTDRRAGRVATEISTELCKILDGQVINGVEVIVRPVKDHRCIIVFRGSGLFPEVNDSDPQQLGVPPLPFINKSEGAAKLALVASLFVDSVKTLLADKKPANMLLFRGFSKLPDIPSMNDIFKLKTAAIASYPMYRGLARLVGMNVLEHTSTIDEEIDLLEKNYDDYDFFFVHYKPSDAAGEDGNFSRKVEVLEDLDKRIPRIVGLNPDVIVVGGDHSTPAMLAGHSWHPVPVMIHSKRCRTDTVTQLTETACLGGGLGRIPATDVMTLAMANALKLNKFGA